MQISVAHLYYRLRDHTSNSKRSKCMLTDSYTALSLSLCFSFLTSCQVWMPRSQTSQNLYNGSRSVRFADCCNVRLFANSHRSLDTLGASQNIFFVFHDQWRALRHICKQTQIPVHQRTQLHQEDVLIQKKSEDVCCQHCDFNHGRAPPIDILPQSSKGARPQCTQATPSGSAPQKMKKETRSHLPPKTKKGDSIGCVFMMPPGLAKLSKTKRKTSSIERKWCHCWRLSSGDAAFKNTTWD